MQEKYPWIAFKNTHKYEIIPFKKLIFHTIYRRKHRKTFLKSLHKTHIHTQTQILIKLCNVHAYFAKYPFSVFGSRWLRRSATILKSGRHDGRVTMRPDRVLDGLPTTRRANELARPLPNESRSGVVVLGYDNRNYNICVCVCGTIMVGIGWKYFYSTWINFLLRCGCLLVTVPNKRNVVVIYNFDCCQFGG